MKPRKFAPFRSHSSFAVALSVALFTHFAAPSASATAYYWDSDGTTAGFGNTTGTWGTDAFWSTTAAGTGATANTAITTADTVNFGTSLNYANAAVGVLAGGVSVNKIVFGTGQTTGITLSGGAISLGGSAPSITANTSGQIISSAIALGAGGTVSFCTSGTAGTFTLNGQISGGFGLTFTTPNVSSGGTNQIVTLGAANTYTGNTTITTANVNNTTIIRAGVANALPTTTVLTLNGGNGTGSGRTVSYDLNGKNQTLAGLSSTTGLSLRNQQITNSSGATTTLTINNTSPASSTFGGDITGTNLRLTKTGTGTQILSATSGNTYTGITTISDGKLVGVVGGNQSSSDVTVNNVAATYGVSITDNTKKWTCKSLATTAAGTLEFNFGAILPSETVSPLLVTNAAAFTVTPPVSVVVTTGLLPGTYPLMTWGSTSGTAPSTPDLTLSALAAGTAASLSVSGNTLNLVITSTATAVVKANNTDNLNLGSSWVGAAAPDVTKLAKWNGTVTSANTTDLGADATWAGIVIENPNGLVTINGTNILTLGAGALDIDMSAATADLALNCPVALSGTNNWDVAASRTVTLSGQVSGAFAINKLGAGTAVLSSAANSYTGTTTVSTGTLQLGAGNVIPNGASIGNVVVDGTLDLNGNSDTINGLSGSGIIDNLAATTTSTLTVGANNQTSTFSGVLQNSGSTATLNLTKTGTGALTLAAANTFTGITTVSGGNLILGHASALGDTTGISLAGGTTLTPGISGININKPITLGATGTTATITAPDVAGSGTTNFPVTLSGGISGDGNVSFNGVSDTNAYGVVNLSAASNYAGSTLITTTAANNNAAIFMNLGVANALPVTTVVTMDGGNGTGTSPGRYCELDLNGKNQTLAGLTNVTGRTLRVQRIVNNSVTAATLTVNNSVDYAYSGQLGYATGQYGSTAYNNFGLTKSGIGTFTISGANTYTGDTTVTGGTLALGASNVLPNASAVSIGGGTLAAGAGFTDTVGTLAVTSAATINLGSGTSVLSFADSSAETWAGPLNLTGTFVSGTSLRFGTTNAGLTPAQLASISSTGFTGFALDATGYLTATFGGGPGPVDHFDISAIASPQTVGTPITGITLTAKDASNATATGFTGTVTFGGTGGFTGTSASFTAGVLNSVSVTPTVAGGSLTFTVTDGALPTAHTGSTTITTVQTQYQAWAGGALFDADANGDGVKNGLAWILGASGPNTSALDKLPTTSTSGGNMILTFKRTQASINANTALSIEVGTTLASWPSLYTVGADTLGSTAGVAVAQNTPGAGTDTVTLTVAQSPDAKKFARLKAVQLP